jgi:hypothetical protein
MSSPHIYININIYICMYNVCYLFLFPECLDSIAGTWQSCLNNHADLKELIPAFYDTSETHIHEHNEWLQNLKNLDLGTTQQHTRVKRDKGLISISKSISIYIVYSTIYYQCLRLGRSENTVFIILFDTSIIESIALFLFSYVLYFSLCPHLYI